jgi:hypothetical protein
MARRMTAVELYEALAKLGDMLAALTLQQGDELRASMPPGIMALADQANAAQAQSIAWAEHGDCVAYVPRTGVDEWIRLGLLDALINWIDGRGRTCMHAPDYRRPEPVFACAWKPGLVVCAQCTHLLGVTGIADATCDRCGRLCEGIEADDPIYTGTIWLGELAYEFGTCGDCRPEAQRRRMSPDVQLLGMPDS